MVEELDWSVGEVLAALKRSGAESNTLVIFASDNGPWYQGGAGPLRGRKGATWDGGQRVPFLARFPGRIPRGQVSHAVAGAMDLHPTIAKLCGAEAKNPFDGVDIWPLLTAAKPALEDREAFLYFDGVYLQCARQGKWKLHIARHNVMIYNPVPQAGRISLPLAKPELYDLTADPGESYHVAAENPAVVADLQARIARVMATMPEPIRQAHIEQMRRKTTAPPAGSLPRPVAN